MQRLLSLAALLAFSCAASAQTTLDVTVPGNTVCSYTTGPVTTGGTPGHLQATATGMAGTGCGSTSSGSGGVTFGPASPLSPSSVPALGNSGGTATFTFQPINASACTGTITPTTGTSFTTFCNSAATCSGPQSVTASFPANSSTTTDASYTVGVSCTGPNSPTPVASPVSPRVTVLHTTGTTGGSCPDITSVSSGIAAFKRWSGNASVVFTSKGVHSVAITDYDSFWLSTAWPGSQSGLVAQVTLPNDKYVSLQFAVPAGYLAGQPAGFFAEYLVGQTGYSVPYSMTISTTCGDFSNPATNATSTVAPGCYKNLMGSTGGLVTHKTGAGCVLQDNKTYYLNFINADISNVQPGGLGNASSDRVAAKCPNGACPNAIQATWGVP